MWSQTAYSGCFSISLINPQGFYAGSKATNSKQAEFDLGWPLWGRRGTDATRENDAVTTNSKGHLSICHIPPPGVHMRVRAHVHARTQVYACVHFPQGLSAGQASHIRWMNSRSVLLAVCSLPPKESSRDSDSKIWSCPRSLLPASVRVKALEGSKMESEREIIDLQVSSLRERGRRVEAGGAEVKLGEGRITILVTWSSPPSASLSFLLTPFSKCSLSFISLFSFRFPVWFSACFEICERGIV